MVDHDQIGPVIGAFEALCPASIDQNDIAFSQMDAIGQLVA